MVIPHYFSKEPLGNVTNADLHSAINQVRQSSNKKEAITRAYSIITSKYKGYRLATYLLFWKGFEKDPNKLWQRQGFMHCTHQNFLLRLLLIKSKWFTDDDINLGFSKVWYISPHQYLIVKTNGEKIALDPWSNQFGVPMGYYATGFGYKKQATVPDPLSPQNNSGS